MATKVEQLLAELEDKAILLQKAQTNLKKCPKQRLTKGYIETRLDSIEEYWKCFTTTHNNLLKCVPKEKRTDIPYFANEEYFCFEELYLSLQGDLKDLLSGFQSIPSAHIPTSQNASSDGHVKLPRILLPTFSGVYEDWPAFQDLFTSLVHNNYSLSKVQKLHYLKSSITGEAEFLLKHIQVTEANYHQAWDLLKGRYGNKRIIVNSILKKLFMQKKIPNQTAHHIKSLLDTTNECINSLKNLNISTDSWDPLIVFLVVQKLDSESHRDWEEQNYKDNLEELPTYADLEKFLQSKFRTLELVTPQTKEKSYIRRDYAVHLSTEPSTVKQRNCPMCTENHTLCHCDNFTKLDPAERSEYVKNNNLCYNCLASGHSARKCRLRMSCRICYKRHHTLVHQANTADSNQSSKIQAHHLQVDNQLQSTSANESNIELSSYFAASTSTALLATALVPVRNETGHVVVLRALIDHGSQATFISERAAQTLRIKREPVHGTITGVGSTKTVVKYATEIELLSRHDDSFNIKVKAYIIPTQLTTQLPSQSICMQDWQHLQGLALADPSFNKSARIDLLLGVEVYARILKNDIIKGPPGTPCAQNTDLGWIIFGNIHSEKAAESLVVHHLSLNLDNMLKTMWELDKNEELKQTKEERQCEEIYQTTTTRTEEGRYIVKLPTKKETLLATQGQTRSIALKRLYQQEQRLERNPTLREEYVKVMEEYIEMKHMEEVSKEELNKPSYYMPHHSIVKEDKETTKVRVVFNASQKGLNNTSLNDELLVGPQIQADMRSLIMKWRMKKVCFVADIQRMYRQILVKPKDKDLQRVLWRSNTKEPVKDYRLTRVTFGTASAPYLAVRTLKQVACDEGAVNVDAAKAINSAFFVDDLMCGEDTLPLAIEKAKNIDEILKRGGFVLHKWCSNNADFLKEFKPTQRSSHVNLDITIDGTVRALGLQWNMGHDVFEYSLKLPPLSEPTTKRTILADVQRLFDPLGFVAPALLPAKLLIQRLWLQGLAWDEEVDSSTAENWKYLRETLQYLSDIKIKRWLSTIESQKGDITIHGFCDASTKAYAAVVYVRVQKEDGNILTEIVAAKTRVAPVKPVSLPRLELCGALLLSRLLKQIKTAMNIPEDQIFAWTDSTIVLSWLLGDPARWQTFVRNRVVEILDNVGHKWYHVQTTDNPADVATRGESASALKEDEQWWKGPEWLRDKIIYYTRPKELTTNLEERREETMQVNLALSEGLERNSVFGKLEMLDSLPELLKTIVYCKRFLKGRKMRDKNIPMTTEELDQALKSCIRIVQQENFDEEIQSLEQRGQVKKNSRIKSLQPYLDEDNIIRVGGRLRHADLNHDHKHPIILDKANHLTVLIIKDAHARTLHGGVQLMMQYLRAKFWILRAKGLVKARIRKCLICAKQSAAARTQLMGDLPKMRVTPSRPFIHSGVDFAGPFQVLASKGRGIRTNKAYVCIFVCMATKALHLEAVGDLTSESFIGAFKRFVARRGKCAHLWSDQGRNFVGANKELVTAWNDAKFEFKGAIEDTLALDGTQWHFIPSYSPHMGGLWEAGVKSVKFHMKRILSSHLTFEELTTLLCQIEACLNSRPLTPIDDADTEHMPLTPGHFLIGEAPIVVPQPDVRNIPVSHLTRWQHIQKLLADFWHKWQAEYLSNLQQRRKWLKGAEEFEIGSIVLLKSENLPPGKWAMGRIVAKHPGPDDVTRVYSVKSGSNVVQRNVTKLCPLPIDLN